MEGREGRSRGLLLKDGIGKGGKWEGRGREEIDKKKGRGTACVNNKNRCRTPGHAVSINFAAR